jgi:hypothetical protein
MRSSPLPIGHHAAWMLMSMDGPRCYDEHVEIVVTAASSSQSSVMGHGAREPYGVRPCFTTVVDSRRQRPKSRDSVEKRKQRKRRAGTSSRIRPAACCQRPPAYLSLAQSTSSTYRHWLRNGTLPRASRVFASHPTRAGRCDASVCGEGGLGLHPLPPLPRSRLAV